MKRVTTRRAEGCRYSRSGLPLTCGAKLPDGTECERRTVSQGACAQHGDPATRLMVPVSMPPSMFRGFYHVWLKTQQREPVIPDDLERFLQWWARSPDVDGVRVPLWVKWSEIKELWLHWCRLSGHPDVVPFDLSLFCAWWQVT